MIPDLGDSGVRNVGQIFVKETIRMLSLLQFPAIVHLAPPGRSQDQEWPTLLFRTPTPAAVAA